GAWWSRRSGGGRWRPGARPGVREVEEAEAFEDGAAGGECVDQEVTGAKGQCVPGAGGDQGTVKAPAAVGRERAAAIKAREGAGGVGVEPADGGGAAIIVQGHIGEVFGGTGGDGGGELAGGEGIVLGEDLLSGSA